MPFWIQLLVQSYLAWNRSSVPSNTAVRIRWSRSQTDSPQRRAHALPFSSENPRPQIYFTLWVFLFPNGCYTGAVPLSYIWYLFLYEHKEYIHTEKIPLNKSTFEILHWEINFRQWCVVMEIHICTPSLLRCVDNSQYILHRKILLSWHHYFSFYLDEWADHEWMI